MSEPEKIEVYTQKTGIPKSVWNRYGIRFKEMHAMTENAGSIDIVCRAFSYGMAKGYRAGKRANQSCGKTTATVERRK